MSDVSDQWWTEFASNPTSPQGSASAARWQRWSRSADERAMKNAAKAEKKIGRALAWLGEDWHVLHVVEHDDRDVEHILIGPAGVVSLTTLRLRNSHVLVTDSRVLVDGQARNYIRESRFASHRLEQMLAEKCGQPVRIRSVLVFVDLDDFIVQQMPSDVHATTCRRLLPWLKSLAETTDSATVEWIHEAVVGAPAHQFVA